MEHHRDTRLLSQVLQQVLTFVFATCHSINVQLRRNAFIVSLSALKRPVRWKAIPAYSALLMVGLEIVSKPLRKMQDDDGIQQQWKPSHEFDQIAWKQKVRHRELLEQNLGLIARFVEERLSS